MQLKIVVFPAPLGPMRPTISYSFTRMLTSVSAWTPPKRMLTSVASRTDIDALRAATAVPELEPLALQPPADGRRERAQALGLEDQGEDCQHAGDHLHVVPGVGRHRLVDVLGQLGKVEPAEDVEDREGGDATSPAQ